MRPDPRQYDGAGQSDRKGRVVCAVPRGHHDGKGPSDCRLVVEIDNALTVAMTDMIVNGADVQQTLDQLAVTIDGLLAE